MDCLFSLSVDIKNRFFLVGEKSGNIMVISYIWIELLKLYIVLLDFLFLSNKDYI